TGLVAFPAIVSRLPGRRRNDEAAGVFTVDAAGVVSAVLPSQPMSRGNTRRFLRGAVAINAAGAVALAAAAGSVEGAFLFVRGPTGRPLRVEPRRSHAGGGRRRRDRRHSARLARRRARGAWRHDGLLREEPGGRRAAGGPARRRRHEGRRTG